MAIKKSQLYSKLWDSCDELRGSMDASQYKDYVLVLLFIKYISDKWAGKPYAPIHIPEGASFDDMAALKGETDIGDQINKKILKPIQEANDLSDMPDFNDDSKLGSGKDKVDTLSKLIAIFEDPKLNFSSNKADGDDILGDAYEYLMRHFATESGKSKGQFYTPSEVSRIVAKVVGIHSAETSGTTTVYDPTCGSGSLLLKVSDEAKSEVSLYGQENDSATAGLARMNMILHDNADAVIKQGNTMASPKFLDPSGGPKQFDYIVANPPFSYKKWSNGLTLPEDGAFNRFQGFGTPPNKNGDYAFLLHIVKSLKSNGKGAVILPHGVLFRGNAEAEIRANLIKRKYIRAIIGLPANLFYGTGIPATIILIDKENAHQRSHVYLIDASKGFIKDGNKNRLRDQDIHKIIDAFENELEIPGYSKKVPIEDIESNEYNLNIPRYIDSQDKEDIEDIEGHLKGGIPADDIEAMSDYWNAYPELKDTLFEDADRPNYKKLRIPKEKIHETIIESNEFKTFNAEMRTAYNTWWSSVDPSLQALQTDCKPKELIKAISEGLLSSFNDKPLVDPYSLYQKLLDYWNDTMQDDLYLISGDGWKAETYRIVETKKNKKVDKGWTCDLLPKELIIEAYFKDEQGSLNQLKAKLESAESEMAEMKEENGGEDGYFEDETGPSKASVTKRIKELKEEDEEEGVEILTQYLKLVEEKAAISKSIKAEEKSLDKKLLEHYPKLDERSIRDLAINCKWKPSIETLIEADIEAVSQTLAERIKLLADRYESPLPYINERTDNLESKVEQHLQAMGFVWK